MAPIGSNEGELKLIGGELCLDFVNTVDWHDSDSPIERLIDYDSLLSWSRLAGSLSQADERRLREHAGGNPAAAQNALGHAITIREALYRLLAALVHGRPMDAADAAVLSDAFVEAPRSLRIVAAGDGLEWQWAGDPEDLEMVLWPVVHSAADLLTSSRRSRVGQCSDDRGCGWIFLDSSKNLSRRWCSMEDCGNRAKARRHYERARGA
jgi:predicted RNA-binding Zn ribbon-like protein